MFLSSLSIKRPIMVTMALFVFIVFGAMAYYTLNLNLIPDVEFPMVTVQTIYQGAGPNEIETQVTKRIEDAISTVSQIDYMQSFSMEGVSLIMVRFELDKDVDIASQEVKDKIDGILSDLPDDVERPAVMKFDVGAEPVMELVLSGGESPKQLWEYADKNLKDRFAQIEGVAELDISGGEEREIKVELDNKTVFSENISLTQLAQTIAAYNLDMPGGQFQKSDQEYTVRLKGEYPDLETLGDLDIHTGGGVKKLRNVANISDSSENVRERSVYFNNEEKVEDKSVVRLSIVKSKDGNAVVLAEKVKEQLPEIAASLPPGMKLTVFKDDSVFIKSSVEDTLSNIFLGIIFTGLVLLFFLHDLRSTVIVALSMPTSIVSTFILMQWAGFSLNVFSLMGLSTSIGVLVANSVVVLENIFRHKELGHGKKESAEIGTAEVTVAVFASTLTNVVVFLPIATMSSLVGQLFREFGLTVVFATLFSLVISFTLTPMLASLILPEKKRSGAISRGLEKLFHGMESWYGNVLKHMLRKRFYSVLIMLASFGLFIVSIFHAGTQLGFEFMPTLDEGELSVEIEMPQGYNLDETGVMLDKVTKVLASHKEVNRTITTIGKLGDTNTGTNLAIMSVKLVDAQDRNLTTEQFNDMIIQELSVIPGAILRSEAKSSAGMGGATIDLTLRGTDLDKLQEIKDDLMSKFQKVPGIINLKASLKSGKPELTLSPNREKLKEYGVSIYEIAMQLRAAVDGSVASQYRTAGDEYDIRVCLNEESTNDPQKIGNIYIITATGPRRLADICDVRFTEGVNAVEHYNKIKAVKFTAATAAGVAAGDVMNGMNDVLAKYQLPSGYATEWGGMSKEMNSTIGDMVKTFILAILLTYMLLAAILESFLEPIYILMTLPLALIGVLYAMLITGQVMNIFSMMAIIMLVGIVVNNAILLLDYTKILIARGKSTHDALIEACPTKLKAILMSSLAIMLGMLPMALGIGDAGAEFRVGMGIVSIGGLIVSTFLALFIIPAVYYMFSKKHPTREIEEN